MLVLDASAAVGAALPRDGFEVFRHEPLVAPPLLLSEAASALYAMTWRGTISDRLAGDALGRLLRAPIEVRSPQGLLEAAWEVADTLGWAKTYDAEYVALARLLGCALVTVDARLARSAGRLVEARSPASF